MKLHYEEWERSAKPPEERGHRDPNRAGWEQAAERGREVGVTEFTVTDLKVSIRNPTGMTSKEVRDAVKEALASAGFGCFSVALPA